MYEEFKMVGRSRKNDVKSRLGKRNLTTAKPKTGRIRDARDVLKQKGSAKVEISVDISCFALVFNAGNVANVKRFYTLAM